MKKLLYLVLILSSFQAGAQGLVINNVTNQASVRGTDGQVNLIQHTAKTFAQLTSSTMPTMVYDGMIWVRVAGNVTTSTIGYGIIQTASINGYYYKKVIDGNIVQGSTPRSRTQYSTTPNVDSPSGFYDYISGTIGGVTSPSGDFLAIKVRYENNNNASDAYSARLLKPTIGDRWYEQSGTPSGYNVASKIHTNRWFPVADSLTPALNDVLTWNGTRWVAIQPTGGGGGGAVSSVAGRTGVVVLTSADVGLGSTNNTSDVDKPVSTATQTALLGKQAVLTSGTNIKSINSTSLLGSGDLAVQPPLVSGTNIKTLNGNTLLGSGDIVISAGGGSTVWGGITGTLSSQTDLNTALTSKEPGLGNPSTNGYILSSTTAGVRNWIAPPSGGGQLSADNSTGKTIAVNPTTTNDAYAYGFNNLNWVIPYGNMIIYSAIGGGGHNFYSSSNGSVVAAFGNQNNSYIQNPLRIGGSTGLFSNVTNAATAILELVSTERGFLPPRMTTTQRDAITGPAEGLKIYNLTTHNDDVYNGTTWTAVGSGTPGAPPPSMTLAARNSLSSPQIGQTIICTDCTADNGTAGVVQIRTNIGGWRNLF